MRSKSEQKSGSGLLCRALVFPTGNRIPMLGMPADFCPSRPCLAETSAKPNRSGKKPAVGPSACSPHPARAGAPGYRSCPSCKAAPFHRPMYFGIPPFTQMMAPLFMNEAKAPLFPDEKCKGREGPFPENFSISFGNGPQKPDLCGPKVLFQYA